MNNKKLLENLCTWIVVKYSYIHALYCIEDMLFLIKQTPLKDTQEWKLFWLRF
jgi:hypothetical protein